MDRNNQTNLTRPIEYRDSLKQTAYHEAGHAAAIYLYNKSNNLPPVYFQITTKEIGHNKILSENSNLSDTKQLIAKIEGGQLILNHPAFLMIGDIEFTETENQAYQTAYQADIVNLFAGPLAEAKYVALRDNEIFNSLLVNANALKFYGGTSDLNSVYDYLEHFISNKYQREQQLTALFNKAFTFINDPAIWKAITTLASYILNHKNKTISCEEVHTVLDKGIALYTSARTMYRFK